MSAKLLIMSAKLLSMSATPHVMLKAPCKAQCVHCAMCGLVVGVDHGGIIKGVDLFFIETDQDKVRGEKELAQIFS